jgi:hypothetical protein
MRPMGDDTYSTAVSFAETPLAEISAKATELEAHGWVFDEERKGDPWVVLLSKRFSGREPDLREAELRALMGTYWVDLDPPDLDAST